MFLRQLVEVNRHGFEKDPILQFNASENMPEDDDDGWDMVPIVRLRERKDGTHYYEPGSY